MTRSGVDAGVPDLAEVVGLGEISLDYICVLDGHPAPGEKRALRSLSESAGGQVASALLACARLGARTRLLGAVGTDHAADAALAPLEREGVDVGGVRRIEGARTREAIVLVRAADGERTVLGHRDDRLRVDPASLSSKDVVGARVVLVDTTDPEAAYRVAQLARAAGIPVVLDADQLWPNHERLLAVTDFPVVSSEFAEEFGGTGSLADGLARLAGWGARLAVVTCGSEGAYARSGDRELHERAFEVETRDTTGAGDAFHAGFIWGLLQGQAPEAALRTANAVAALTCTALGAQDGLPSRESLEGLLEAGRTREPARTSRR